MKGGPAGRVLRGGGAARGRDRRRSGTSRTSAIPTRRSVPRSPAPVIRELAPSTTSAFVLEGARENGDIVSSRKGITDYTLTIHGRAAHAGVEPEKGRNAMLRPRTTIIAPASAQRTLARRDAERGHGPGRYAHERGARSDASCERRPPLAGDCDRSRRPSARSSGICARAVDAGRHRGGARRRLAPADGEEGGGRRLAALREGVAAELGFELRDAATGGASDANTTPPPAPPARRPGSGRRRRSRARRSGSTCPASFRGSALLAGFIAVVRTP